MEDFFANTIMNNSFVCHKHFQKEMRFIIENVSIFRASFIVSICLLVLISLISILANSLIIAAILKTPSLRKPSYILITSTAVTDLMLSLTSYPSFVVSIVWTLQKDIDLICRAYFFYLMISLSFVGVSFMMSFLISIDRSCHRTYLRLATNRQWPKGEFFGQYYYSQNRLLAL